ncbi:MAG: DNA polymerase III subunit gamma/tau, partial [Desulfomonilaceae bacterium]|nr:DNA polymerase III subunit gamma/tau [Desulfomonilaceae bacterium]
SGRVAHAFLFCGVRGVGKTTVARILAKALNCSGRGENEPNPCNKCTSCMEINAGSSIDVQEIDGASHTSVENIREINENIKYPPVSSPFKIIIIDEVHMISINAFNALLKTLEEPPGHAKFMFATTESHKVPATINSRCQRFNFRTISVSDIIGGMSRILEQEGIEATEDALALIAREARGSFRDGLSLLDQVISFGSQRITANDAIEILGVAGRDCFGRLINAVLSRDPATALGVVNELYRQGYDPEQFVLDMIQFLRNLIVTATVPEDRRPEGMIDAPPSEVTQMEDLVKDTSPEELQNLFGMLMRSENEVKRSSNPWIAVEMTVLRMCFAPELTDLAEVLRRIDTNAPSGGARKPTATRRSYPDPVPRDGASSSPERQASPVVDTVAGEGPERGESTRKDRFTITGITPLPTGTPDEVWANLQEAVIKSNLGPAITKNLEHGSLISFGPTEVEIGFNRKVYRERFEGHLESKKELKRILEEFFGDVHIKILTLTQETTLHTGKPYVLPQDGNTDYDRAVKSEAMENALVQAVLGEFEGSYIEDIKIGSPKP